MDFIILRKGVYVQGGKVSIFLKSQLSKIARSFRCGYGITRDTIYGIASILMRFQTLVHVVKILLKHKINEALHFWVTKVGCCIILNELFFTQFQDGHVGNIH